MNIEERKAIEYLILVFLGVKNAPVTLTHLQKEIFLLWNFDSRMKDFIRFIKHKMGPYSPELSMIVKNPKYLQNSWVYIESTNMKGGKVCLTTDGHKKAKEIIDEMTSDDKLRTFLTGIKLTRELYEKLTVQELLLLIYEAYPEFKIYSTVLEDIKNKKELYAMRILKKGIIDEKKYDEIIKCF